MRVEHSPLVEYTSVRPGRAGRILEYNDLARASDAALSNGWVFW